MKGKFRKLFIAACIIAPLLFFGVVVVLADVWTGPKNRVTAGTCTIHHYHSGTLVCSEPCGEPEYHICTAACDAAGGCDSSTTDNNPGHSLPDATVSGSTSCSSPGDNGWCRGTATLHLSGTEPVSGYHITGFDSDQYNYLCSGSSCDWNFPQGVTTALGYWAISSFGDQSDQATVSLSVDSVAPTLTLTIPSSNGSNDWNKTGPVAATVSATDATSGVAGVDINGGGASFTASSDGVYTLTATATDKAGNTSTTSGTIKLDTIPPDLSVSPAAPDGENGWYVSPALVTSTDSDATSGVANTQVQVDGGPWQDGTSVNVETDGTHTLVFLATDVAGNTTTSAPVTVMVDRTAPVPDFAMDPTSPNGANGWYNLPVTVTADSSDATSGVASQGVSLDGSIWTPSLTISSNGTYTVQVRATDQAGNTASSSKTIHLDATPPTASFVLPSANGNNGWYVSPVTGSVSGTDATSGVASQLVSLDGSSWSGSLNLTSDGIYTVNGRVTDLAGNTTNISQIVSIDATPPVIDTPVLSGTPGLEGWYTSTVGVWASATDATSGIASTAYSVDGGVWMTTAPILTDGVHTVQIKVTDKAGNVSRTSASASVDATPPVSAFISPAEGSTTNISGNQVVHLIGATSDATSGVASAGISLDDGRTWQGLPLRTGDAWAYDWNCLRNNGTYTFLVRASDHAGNLEHTAKVTIVVGNQAPSVSLTSFWVDLGSASVSIRKGSLPVAGASITVQDPLGRWPSADFSYNGSALPTKFVWLGRMGNGAIATIGKYRVTVKAWDAFGNTGTASGWVIIPLPPPQPTVTPTATAAALQPTAAASATPARLAVGIPAATPTPAPKKFVPTPAPTLTQVAPAKKPASTPWWPVSFTGSLFVLFLFLSVLDPRPAAWRLLARIKAQKH